MLLLREPCDGEGWHIQNSALVHAATLIVNRLAARCSGPKLTHESLDGGIQAVQFRGLGGEEIERANRARAMNTRLPRPLPGHVARPHRSEDELSADHAARSVGEKRQHGLEVASVRGREVGLVEFRAAGPGDVSKDALAAEPVELAIVVLRLRTAGSGSDDVDPIPAFGAQDFSHRPASSAFHPQADLGVEDDLDGLRRGVMRRLVGVRTSPDLNARSVAVAGR
jgi:hypothetical protein